jgi:DNA polymerase III delta subunit
MLYFIHGTDIKKVVEKAHGLVNAMLVKKPNASLFKISTDNWSEETLQELLVSQALFENKYIVELSRLIDREDVKESVVDSLKEIQESENIFIWLEEEVDSKTLSKIEKFAEKVQQFDAKKEFKKVEFNIFSLADALGNRDKKKLWMLYQDAKKFFAVEEIHGTLFWQAKSMLISTKTKSATESGLKPFVYTKSLKMAKNFSPEELLNLSSKLISISHDSRRGIHDFDIALEKFCLEI